MAGLFFVGVGFAGRVFEVRTSSDWIGNLITIAPLLGFLGTLYGLSKAFYWLPTAVKMEKITTAEYLGPEINLALWTTVFGLIIAIIFSILRWIMTSVKGIEEGITTKRVGGEGHE